MKTNDSNPHAWRLLAEALLAESLGDPARSQFPMSGGQPEIERLAQSMFTLGAETLQRQQENVRPGTASGHTASQGSGSSAVGDALKTAAMVTGVGPLVTGLITLFGGGDDRATAATPFERYTPPPSVALEAGLTAERGFASVSRGQEGLIRRDVAAQPEPQQAPRGIAPEIRIEVRAMDSKSFLDHSDEIAQAVRVAMLRSHALNDVVAEV